MIFPRIILMAFVSLIACACFAQNKEVLELIEPANKGSKSATYSLGVHYGGGIGVRQDIGKAHELYRIIAIHSNRDWRMPYPAYRLSEHGLACLGGSPLLLAVVRTQLAGHGGK